MRNRFAEVSAYRVHQEKVNNKFRKSHHFKGLLIYSLMKKYMSVTITEGSSEKSTNL